MSDTETLKISTREEAFDYIEKALAGALEEQLLEIDIQGDWSTISILIKGENYHATLNGRLVKALADLQTQLNRIYASAVYGKSAKALSNEEREEIELIFKISESSSLVTVDLGDWLTKVSEAGIEKMTGTELVVLVLGVAVIFGSYKGYQAWNARKQHEADQTEETKRQAQAQQAETERQQKLIDQMARQNETIQLALKERKQLDEHVLKATPTATSVDINEQHYTRDDIEEANRSERKTSDLQRADGDYFVSGITTRATGFVVNLMSERGDTLRAELERDRLNEEELDRLWQAMRDERSVSLKLTARVRNDVVTSATVIGLVKPAHGDTGA